MDERNETSPARPRYKWPWVVLLMLLTGLALAAAWIGLEARRLRQYRDPAWPSARSNQPPPLHQGPANSARLPGDALRGGDVAAGRKVFFEKPEASCGKCHKVAGQGGETGPALDGIASRQTREFILESMLQPNCRTTAGFESVIVLLKNGSGYSGFLKSETENELAIQTAEEGLITVRKSDVQIRQPGLSPMPEGLGQVLSRQDLRDVIEFVASLKD